MSQTIVCIDWMEPTFLASLAVSAVLMWFAVRLMTRVARRVRGPWWRGGWLLTSFLIIGASSVLLPVLLTSVLFSLMHGSLTFACLHFVRPFLLFPVGVALIAAIREVRESRNAVT